MTTRSGRSQVLDQAVERRADRSPDEPGFGEPEARRHRVGDRGRVADRRQLDEEGVLLELGVAGQLLGEARLPGAAGPDDRHQPVIADQLRQGREVGRSPDEAAERRREVGAARPARPAGRRARSRDGSWARIAASRACSSGPGVEPELLAEHVAGGLEGPQGLGLPARPVEGEHRKPWRRSRSGASLDEVLQLGHELGVGARSCRSASMRSSSAVHRSSSRRLRLAGAGAVVVGAVQGGAAPEGQGPRSASAAPRGLARDQGVAPALRLRSRSGGRRCRRPRPRAGSRRTVVTAGHRSAGRAPRRSLDTRACSALAPPAGASSPQSSSASRSACTVSPARRPAGAAAAGAAWLPGWARPRRRRRTWSSPSIRNSPRADATPAAAGRSWSDGTARRSAPDQGPSGRGHGEAMTTTATATRSRSSSSRARRLYGHPGEPSRPGASSSSTEELEVGDVLQHAPGTFDLVTSIDPSHRDHPRRCTSSARCPAGAPPPAPSGSVSTHAAPSTGSRAGRSGSLDPAP